ncbi:hypothetical protein ACQPZG_04055 (plasmid) [Streptomyces sp. CA-294286]|uniref:hypothetical protein n=1 Tax=Streptomyces sp. CA-294286 TaxID=3240070 RepID=UPI003D8C865F
MRLRTARYGAAILTAVFLTASTGCSSKDETQRLAMGEPATVPAKGDGTVTFTVRRIEKGNASDLKALDKTEQYVGKTPYYVRFAYTKTEADGDYEAWRLSLLAGETSLTGLSVLPSFDFQDPMKPKTRRFDRCLPADSETYRKAGKGDTVEGCAVYLAEEGTGEASRVALIDGNYTNSPQKVTWE